MMEELLDEFYLRVEEILTRNCRGVPSPFQKPGYATEIIHIYKYNSGNLDANRDDFSQTKDVWLKKWKFKKRISAVPENDLCSRIQPMSAAAEEENRLNRPIRSGAYRPSLELS